MIFLLKSKLWAVGLTGPDWFATGHDSIRLNSALEVWQKFYKSRLLDSFLVKN